MDNGKEMVWLAVKQKKRGYDVASRSDVGPVSDWLCMGDRRIAASMYRCWHEIDPGTGFAEAETGHASQPAAGVRQRGVVWRVEFGSHWRRLRAHAQASSRIMYGSRQSAVWSRSR